MATPRPAAADLLSAALALPAFTIGNAQAAGPGSTNNCTALNGDDDRVARGKA